MHAQYKFESDVCTIYLAADETGLTNLSTRKMDLPLLETPTKILKQAVKELNEYFAGKRTKFDVPLNPVGTEFQKAVWKELTRIPYGKTISYQELALRINKPKAVRAVGAANGKNPLWMIVPCHRVIGKNGSMTGYAGGISLKKKLLLLESSL